MAVTESSPEFQIGSRSEIAAQAVVPPFLSIVVPTRNEAGNVSPLLDRIHQALKGLHFEVIFVDDSTDNTPEVIESAGAKYSFNVSVIARPLERRNGLGRAVVEGMAAARAEWVVVMDGDLQHPPEVIRQLLDQANATKADLVAASRLTEGGGTDGLSWGRTVLSTVLALGVRVCFPNNLRQVSDPLTGFFLVRRNRLALDQLRPEGFKILLEILVRNPQLSVAEVPFEFAKRLSGASKASPREMLRLFRQTAKLRLLTLRSLLQFLTVGFTGIFVNSGLLYVLTELLGIHYLVSAVIATQGSTAWNFGWTEAWVFRNRPQRSLNLAQRFAGFFVLNNSMLLVRGPLLILLVSGLGINYLVANFGLLVALVLVRYAIADKLIWGTSSQTKAYYYNIHDIIRIRSAQRLPELGYFRTEKLFVEPDFDVMIVGNPRQYRTDHAISYDEAFGRFGFSIVVDRSQSPTKVYASPLVGISPHVLYTNVIEPLLRWSFVQKGYALMHGACVSVDGQALFITAQTDTGKTTTILQIIRKHAERFQFLSDDMTIFTPEGDMLSYPKPLTISKHTLRAAQVSVLSMPEQLFLQIQSRLHSRSGRRFAMLLSKSWMPAATLNAVVQAIIPPPKFMVDRLIPEATIAQCATLTNIAVIERGPDFERRIGEDEKGRILAANAEDAYGFPPYPALAHEMSTWDGQDRHQDERALVAGVIRDVPAIHIRRAGFDWPQRLPFLRTAPLPEPVATAPAARALDEVYVPAAYLSKRSGSYDGK